MAVDTRDRRMSMLGLALPVPSVLPDPDGSLATVGDRTQLIWLYRGIEPEGLATGRVTVTFAVRQPTLTFTVN